MAIVAVTVQQVQQAAQLAGFGALNAADAQSLADVYNTIAAQQQAVIAAGAPLSLASWMASFVPKPKVV